MAFFKCIKPLIYGIGAGFKNASNSNIVGGDGKSNKKFIENSKKNMIPEGVKNKSPLSTAGGVSIVSGHLLEHRYSEKTAVPVAVFAKLQVRTQTFPLFLTTPIKDDPDLVDLR